MYCTVCYQYHVHKFNVFNILQYTLIKPTPIVANIQIHCKLRTVYLYTIVFISGFHSRWGKRLVPKFKGEWIHVHVYKSRGQPHSKCRENQFVGGNQSQRERKHPLLPPPEINNPAQAMIAGWYKNSQQSKGLVPHDYTFVSRPLQCFDTCTCMQVHL